MKTITSALKDHLAEEVTTLCTCWKLVRSDGVVQGFTDHVAELVVSSVTYEAATGFTPSNVKSTEDLAVDNLDVIGLLDSSGIDAGDLASGLYDYADVYIFIVNYEDLSMGTLKLRRGKLGEVTTGRNSFVAEVRGLAQQLQQTIGEVFSLTCRADLGDTRCGLNINPDEWSARTAYASGAVVRPTGLATGKQFVQQETTGYSGSVEPTWVASIGATTPGVETDIIIDGVFSAVCGVNWGCAGGWAISSSVAAVVSAPGSVVALTQMASSNAFYTVPAYNTVYALTSITNGAVRLCLGDTKGTWRTTASTFMESLAFTVTDVVSFEANASFIGAISSVAVTEDVGTTWLCEDSFLDGGAVTSAIDTETFNDSVRSEASTFYNGGLLTFVSGANAGLSREVRNFYSGTFKVVLPFPYAIVNGDTYQVYQGCNKRHTVCASTFDNLINFRGEPFIPGIDEATKFGGQ